MWVIELLADIVGDAVARRIPPWGCALIIAMLAVPVLLVIWLNSGPASP